MEVIKSIAVDFDGTLYEDTCGIWREPGHEFTPRMDVINRLIELQKQGTKLVLWTCRGGIRLQEAVTWCKKYGLVFDKLNEDTDEIKAKGYDKSVKIQVSLYLDDKAINVKEFMNLTKEDVKEFMNLTKEEK